MPLREKLSHAGGEGWVHDTFATPCFCVTKAGRLCDDAFILLLGRGKALCFAGDTGFGFGLLFFVFFNLGDELFDVTSFFNLLLLCSYLLLNLF